MEVGRAVGVFLLSLVDAVVPAAVAAGVVVSLASYGVVGTDETLVWAGVAGGGVYVATLTVGLASAVVRDRPFPVTRALKRLADWWPFLGVPWP